MKKNSPIDYCLYLLAKTISFVFKFIPLSLNIFVARRISFLAFYLFRKKRNIAYKNLKIAFPNYSCKQINKIVKQAFANSAQHFIEIFYLPRIDQRYIEKFIEFEGIEEALSILKNKRGGIFLGLHEGSWEVASVVLGQSLKDYNYSILARTQVNIPLINELLNTYRESKYCKVIRLTDNLRLLIEHLNNGFALGMVADHGAQGGILVDFLGRSALTPTGAVRLALKLDTNLFIGFIKRKGLASHKIIITPYELIKTNDTDKDLKLNLENINHKYEEYIRENPEEYLWFFKRWKHSPQRNILVLSDGKAGHLKQSLAIVDLIKSLPFQIKTDVIDIKFKNKWQKIAFQICGLFFSNKCQGCMKCFKRLFDYEVTQRLLDNYFDAVISCGSSLAMLNKLISFENMAKSIVIMKPGIFSLKRFDLAIIPEHDNAPKFKNVVSIKGALSTKPDKNKDLIETVINNYNLKNPPLSHPVIGVLIGGSNKYLSLDTNTVKNIICSFDEISKELDASFLVSTSRRTSSDIEELLKEDLSKKTNFRMLIIANDYNPEGALDTILYLSDILVVTADSISMISEAINCKKYIFVLKLNKKFPIFLSKYERFVNNLEKEGYIYSPRNNFANKLIEIWNKRPPIKKIDEQQVILERLKQIL